MKKNNIILIAFLCIVLISGCQNNISKSSSLSDESKIINLYADILKTLSNSKFEIDESKYLDIRIKNDKMVCNVYNMDDLSNVNHFVSDLKSTYMFDNLSGIVIKNKDMQYITIENDKICAVKSLKNDEIRIFEKGSSQCHLVETFNENPKFEIYGSKNIDVDYDAFSNVSTEYIETLQKISKNNVYYNEIINNDIVYLKFNTNILDFDSYDVEWFRNNEKLSDKDQVEINNSDDAEYYAVLKANNGTTLVSNKIHVVTNINN